MTLSVMDGHGDPILIVMLREKPSSNVSSERISSEIAHYAVERGGKDGGVLNEKRRREVSPAAEGVSSWLVITL